MAQHGRITGGLEGRQGRCTPACGHSRLPPVTVSSRAGTPPPSGPLSRVLMFQLRLPSWPAPPRPGPSSETASKLPRCHHHLLPVFLLPRGWWPPWVTLAHSTSSSLCCLLGSQPLAGNPITVSLSKEAGCFWCPGGSLGDARGKRVSWQGAEDGAGRGACGAGSPEAGGSKARPKAEGAGGVTG